MSQFRPRLSQQQYKALENLRANERRILGDWGPCIVRSNWMDIWSIAWTPTSASIAIRLLCDRRYTWTTITRLTTRQTPTEWGEATN